LSEERRAFKAALRRYGVTLPLDSRFYTGKFDALCFGLSARRAGEELRTAFDRFWDEWAYHLAYDSKEEARGYFYQGFTTWRRGD
jgi:hypothetical protein